MTTEKLESDINHLRALCALQSAEISALLLLTGRLIEKNPGILGDGVDFESEYLRLRSLSARQQLETLEDSKPQLAADILELLENSCKNHPI
ncbi:hypothetical protein EGM51_09855 [Verrucomicrobia bacterium S94]|nr:hypothetical protein EGM51_09855 [Verrucomicrobia bacterium S94]